MHIAEFQKKIEELYFHKDSKRGVLGTFAWFVEEVGELSRAIRKGERDNLDEEFADVLAWLSTLASLTGTNLETAAFSKYGKACPKCSCSPCGCDEPGPVQEG